jgi:phosphoglycerate dehydrogenase-like enzyme
MSALTVACNYHFEPEAIDLLRRELAPHHLALAEEPGSADIAFGQPGVDGLLAAPSVRWAHVTSAGFTRYDTPEFRAAAKARGLMLTNSSTVFAEPCAEHVFSFIMAQTRKLPFALRVGHEPEWSEAPQVRSSSACLAGQHAVILGLGSIATRLIELLAPFRMTLTGMRRSKRAGDPIPTVTPDEIESVLATADHVISVLPDNAGSRGFINAKRLAAMKPGAVFYNIGRGTTVDQAALAASLRSGHLAAAWLDVIEPEPLPASHPLLGVPNCFLTPHVAGGQQKESEALIRHFLSNLRRFVANEPLADRII